MAPSLKPHSLPLAEVSRPQDFSGIKGQKHLVGPTALLQKLVRSGTLGRVIFWGPPGTGKTTTAHIIAQSLGAPLAVVSAVHASVKDLRSIFEESRQRIAQGGPATLLFLDEVHRLSKSQQDVLLPSLESGDIRFMGATTENPSFTINQAILSRCLVFKFESLSASDLVDLLRDVALKQYPQLTDVDAKALRAMATAADGDARKAIGLLEAVASLADGPALTLDHVHEAATHMPLHYDRQGDMHYDVISAFIKSVRASHPDAAVYYLARMLDGGEDPLFIARRLLILASEDIGNANPTALMLANATCDAVHKLGMPEARIPLSQCTTYLAASPKSNRSYVAINEALSIVRESGSLPVPLHLRNAPTKLMKESGFGAGYRYVHDDPEGSKQQTYLPANLRQKKFYAPIPVGVERQLIENLNHLRPKED
jgi:putative ATPase